MLTIFSGSRHVLVVIVGGAEPIRNEMISKKSPLALKSNPGITVQEEVSLLWQCLLGSKLFCLFLWRIETVVYVGLYSNEVIIHKTNRHRAITTNSNYPTHIPPALTNSPNLLPSRPANALGSPSSTISPVSITTTLSKSIIISSRWLTATTV